MPVLYSMRMFGIDLNVRRQRSLAGRCAFVAVGVVMSLWAALSNFHGQPDFVGNYQFDVKSTKAWLSRLLEYMWFAWNAVVPLTMIEMATLFKWPPLRDSMRQLEDSVGFIQDPQAFHRSLRAVSLTLNVSFVLSVSQTTISTLNLTLIIIIFVIFRSVSRKLY